MKKTLLITVSVVILLCFLFLAFLFARDNIGIKAENLEKDIRSSQKIKDDWTVDGSVSDTMAAFISYPEDKKNHTFSVYVKHSGLSFGYFFRAGGGVYEIEDSIAEFTSKEYSERAFISMNKHKVEKLEINTGNGIEKIEIDSNKPFAIVLPSNAGNICFYDVEGNIVEYIEHTF